MKITNQKDTTSSLDFFPSLFFLGMMMFVPKIDLVPIAGYWQGIRIEDLLILSFFIVFITNAQNYIYHKDFKYKNFLVFFIYIFISNSIAIISGIEVKIIMLIRLFEYIVLLYFFDNLKINLSKIKNILYLYLFVNFVIVILQHYEFVGNFSSLGYQSASDMVWIRTMGLTGGPWELGAVSSIIFFTIVELEKDLKKIFISFCIVNLFLLLAEGRGNFIAFNLASLFVLLFNRNLNFNRKLIFLAFTFLFVYFLEKLAFSNFFDKIVSIDLSYLYYIFNEGVFNDNLPSVDELIDLKVYLSFWYRVEGWSLFINELSENNINLLFGIGLKHIYYDSLLVRILVSTGFIGIILILFLSLRLKFYLMIFFLLSGAFLDLFISMKIFVFTLIMLYVHRQIANNSTKTKNN